MMPNAPSVSKDDTLPGRSSDDDIDSTTADTVTRQQKIKDGIRIAIDGTQTPQTQCAPYAPPSVLANLIYTTTTFQPEKMSKRCAPWRRSTDI